MSWRLIQVDGVQPGVPRGMKRLSLSQAEEDAKDKDACTESICCKLYIILLFFFSCMSELNLRQQCLQLIGYQSALDSD